jgi:hypothetical protein
LADLAFYGIALTLVIIVLGVAEAMAARANSVTSAIGFCLGLQVFSFILGIMAQVSVSCETACSIDDQGIDAGQIAIQMTELLLDDLTDLADLRPLLLGYSKKMLPGLVAVHARLETQVRSDLRVHHITQFLGDFMCSM